VLSQCWLSLLESDHVNIRSGGEGERSCILVSLGQVTVWGKFQRGIFRYIACWRRGEGERKLTVWLSEYLTVWLSDCLTIWLSDWLVVWLSDYPWLYSHFLSPVTGSWSITGMCRMFVNLEFVLYLSLLLVEYILRTMWSGIGRGNPVDGVTIVRGYMIAGRQECPGITVPQFHSCDSWLSDYLTVWQSDCLTVWLSDCLTVWQSLTVYSYFLSWVLTLRHVVSMRINWSIFPLPHTADILLLLREGWTNYSTRINYRSFEKFCKNFNVLL